MPFLLSCAGFVFLGLSYHSWYYLDRQYFDLLLICGVILVSASELMSSVGRAGAASAKATAAIVPELLAIDEKLGGVERKLTALCISVDKLRPPSPAEMEIQRALAELDRHIRS